MASKLPTFPSTMNSTLVSNSLLINVETTEEKRGAERGGAGPGRGVLWLDGGKAGQHVAPSLVVILKLFANQL